MKWNGALIEMLKSRIRRAPVRLFLNRRLDGVFRYVHRGGRGACHGLAFKIALCLKEPVARWLRREGYNVVENWNDWGALLDRRAMATVFAIDPVAIVGQCFIPQVRCFNLVFFRGEFGLPGIEEPRWDRLVILHSLGVDDLTLLANVQRMTDEFGLVPR